MRTISDKIQKIKSLQNDYEKLNVATDLLMDLYMNSNLPDLDEKIYTLSQEIDGEIYKISKEIKELAKTL